MTGQQLRAEYMKRRMYLYTKAFKNGVEPAERNCIKTLKQLVIGKCDYGFFALTSITLCTFVRSQSIFNRASLLTKDRILRWPFFGTLEKHCTA